MPNEEKDQPVNGAASVIRESSPLLMSAADVARAFAVSKATFYRMISGGHFPKGESISANCTRWKRSTVEEWIEAKFASAP